LGLGPEMHSREQQSHPYREKDGADNS
jgi:hypothetical protein